MRRSVLVASSVTPSRLLRSTIVLVSGLRRAARRRLRKLLHLLRREPEVHVPPGRDIAGLDAQGLRPLVGLRPCRERRCARLALAQTFFGAAAPAVRLVSVASPVSARRSPSLIRPVATRLFTSTFTLPKMSPTSIVRAAGPGSAGDRRAKRLGVLRKFGVGRETSLGERLGERRLRCLGARLVLNALHGTALTELADDQGPQSVIGVDDSPAANLSGFGQRAGRQGSDDAGKELDH